MKLESGYEPDPKLDLVLERDVDVPVELVWTAWTQPEHVKRWFVPRPWVISACEIDLRPGGAFRTVMRSPEGQEHDNVGCYLEIVENERLAWTSALAPGYRPVLKATNGPELLFSAIVLLERRGSGTRYTAIAIHGEESAKQTHEKMGFHDGWATCLEQMVECIRSGDIG